MQPLKERLLTTDRSIFEIGPEFKLMGEIDAAGHDNVSAVVDLNYDLSGVSFVFPPQAGSKAGGITPGANREFFLYLISTLCPVLPVLIQLETQPQM
jgi:hypothetical protein